MYMDVHVWMYDICMWISAQMHVCECVVHVCPCMSV